MTFITKLRLIIYIYNIYTIHWITIYISWTSKFDRPFARHLRSPCVQLQPQLRPLRPLRPWNMVSSQVGGSFNGNLLINHDKTHEFIGLPYFQTKHQQRFLVLQLVHCQPHIFTDLPHCRSYAASSLAA